MATSENIDNSRVIGMYGGGGSPGTGGRSSYNYMGSYSIYANNPGFYGFTYGSSYTPSTFGTYYNWSTGQYMNGNNQVSFSQVMAGLESSSNANITHYNNVTIHDWYKKYANGKLEYMDTQYTFSDGSNVFVEPESNSSANTNESWLDKFWNSPLARWIVPDVISISLGGDISWGVGVGAQAVNFTMLTRGKDPGVYVTPTFNTSAGITAGAEGSINLSAGYYIGDPRNISATMLMGYSHSGELSFKALGGASIGGTWSNTGDGYGFINGNLGIGFGVAFSLVYQYQNTVGYQPIWKFKK